jgi:hypothetical protein
MFLVFIALIMQCGYKDTHFSCHSYYFSIKKAKKRRKWQTSHNSRLLSFNNSLLSSNGRLLFFSRSLGNT